MKSGAYSWYASGEARRLSVSAEVGSNPTRSLVGATSVYRYTYTIKPFDGGFHGKCYYGSTILEGFWAKDRALVAEVLAEAMTAHMMDKGRRLTGYQWADFIKEDKSES